jgi:hypothetical protein
MSFPFLPFLQTIGGGGCVGFSVVDGVTTEGGSNSAFNVSSFGSPGFGGSR